MSNNDGNEDDYNVQPMDTSDDVCEDDSDEADPLHKLYSKVNGDSDNDGCSDTVHSGTTGFYDIPDNARQLNNTELPEQIRNRRFLYAKRTPRIQIPPRTNQANQQSHYPQHQQCPSSEQYISSSQQQIDLYPQIPQNTKSTTNSEPNSMYNLSNPMNLWSNPLNI